jgi:hypothetical protein
MPQAKRRRRRRRYPKIVVSFVDDEENTPYCYFMLFDFHLLLHQAARKVRTRKRVIFFMADPLKELHTSEMAHVHLSTFTRVM